MSHHAWVPGRGPEAIEITGDQPVGDVSALSTAEVFLVCALRLWCGSGGSVACRRILVKNGFRAAGMTERDYISFARVMTTFMAAGRRPLRVASGASRAILRDESAVIEMLGLWQAGEAQGATRIMSTFLPTDTICLCAPAAAEFAESLAIAGLVLRPRAAPHCETRDLLLRTRVLH